MSLWRSVMPDWNPSNNILLEDGDILFQDLVGAGGDAIESVTLGFHDSRISHNAIFFRTATRGYVVEAIYPRVTVTSVTRFLARASDTVGRPAVYVGRLKSAYHSIIPAAISEAFECIGLPYDRVFNTGEDAYYCSELVADAFKYANGGITFFPEHPMNFRDPETGVIHPYWQHYFEMMGVPVPEGEVGSNPGSQSLSPKIEIVHRYGFVTGWGG